MGSRPFVTFAHGTSPEHAFKQAVQDAIEDHVGKGYSGTVGEKGSLMLIPLPDGHDPVAHARALIERVDERIDENFCPAGCISVRDGWHIFFGWAQD